MNIKSKRRLGVLKEDCLSCNRCRIGCREVEEGCSSNVFSNMNLNAKIMVVGQNPGKDEVLQKEPFVGDSGKFFNRVIEDLLGMKREDFYITNVVKCYTFENRKPYGCELDNCSVFLDEEIALVKPKLIIALGAFAFERITGMHGIMKHYGEVVLSLRHRVNVIPVLHPSPHNINNPETREKFYAGMKRVKEYMEGNREIS